jgi:hypothetical protein
MSKALQNFPPSSGAMTLIQTVNTGGSTSTISFAAIPQYNAYMVVFNAINSVSGSNANNTIQFNGDTGAHYEYETWTATTNVVASSQTTGATSMPINTTNDTAPLGYPFSMAWIGNVSSPRHTMLTQGFFGASDCTNGSWNPGSTGFITSMLITSGSGNFQAGGYVSLYGISS